MKIHNLFRLATPLFFFLPSSYCPAGEEGNAVAPVQAGQNAKDDWIDSGFVRGTTAIVGTIDLQQVQSIERLKQVLPPTQRSSLTPVFDRLLSSTQEITKSLGGSKVHFVVDIPGGIAHPPVCIFAQKNSSTDLTKLNAALETFSAGSAVLKGNYVVFLPYHSLEHAERVAIGDDIIASELPKFRDALKALNGFPIQIAIHPPEYLWKTFAKLLPISHHRSEGAPAMY